MGVAGNYDVTDDFDADVDTVFGWVGDRFQQMPGPLLRQVARPEGLVDATEYDAHAGTVLNSAESTTGWATVAPHTGGGPAVDTVNFTTGSASIKAILDMNLGQASKFYYTFTSPQSTTGRTLVAFDLRIQEDGNSTSPQEEVVAKVADSTILTGNYNEVSLQGVPDSSWVTIVLPLAGLTEIKSIGIHRNAEGGESSPSTLRCIFNIDNVRFVDETKLDAALASSTSAVAWVGPNYTPDTDQLPLYLPTGKGIIDAAKGVYSKANNVVYLHDFLAHVDGAETGETDVAHAVGRIINAATSGQTVRSTPGATYRFDSDLTVAVTGVTIDFTGSTCFLTYKSNTPFFRITTSSDVTVIGGTWLGYYPLTANGSTLTNHAGTPTNNGTAKELNAQNEEVHLPVHNNWDVGSHFSRHLPLQVGEADDGLGPRCYWEFVLSDSAQVADDCVISVYSDFWNGMGTSTLLETNTLTLTGTPTTYRISYFPDDFRQRFLVFVKKATATANTITIASATPYGENEYNATYDAASCFRIETSDGITIRDAWVEGFGGDAIQLSNLEVSNLLVDNVSSIKCRRQGMSFNQGTDMRIQNCVIQGTGRSAIDFEPFVSSWYTKRITVTNIKMYDIVNYGLAMGPWARNIYHTIDGVDLYDARIGMLFGGAQRSVFRNLNNYTLANGLANDYQIAGIDSLFENLRTIKNIGFLSDTSTADIAEGAGVVVYSSTRNVVRNVYFFNLFTTTTIDADGGGFRTDATTVRGIAVSVTNGATTQAVTFNGYTIPYTYDVWVTTSWNAGYVWVSNKTSSGFTMNFATAAGAAATASWQAVY